MKLLIAFQTLMFCSSALGQMTVTLSSSQTPRYRVGAPTVWTADVSGSVSGTVEYQFSGRKGSGQYKPLRAFSTSNQAIWTPSESEGTYSIQVKARNKLTGEIAVAAKDLTVDSLVTNGQPVITPTANPLVALYSVPGCPAGDSMYVQFSSANSLVSKTNLMPCTPASSMNVYIGGMLESTAYNMNYVVVDSQQPASIQSTGPIQQFTSGVIDPALAFPTLMRLQVPPSETATQRTLLMDYLSPPGGPYYFPTAVDLEGRVIWYYPQLGVPSQGTRYFLRPVPQSQGHILVIVNDPDASPSKWQILREIDLAGNTVSEVSASQVSEQLAAQGKLGIIDFDHEAIRLSNGHTLVIASQEKIYPTGTQGSSGPIDILGNAIIDLDENWNVAWSWSAYDHMDINRAAVLGETCGPSVPGCPSLALAGRANDWLHANSLNYLPDSGDVLISLRHQDWVLKIDYANGSGSGDVLWRLGAGGDFAITSSDPYPWFSHQHNAQFDAQTGSFLAFDNGNTRISYTGGVGNSRGYVLKLDEASRKAATVMLADLGVYSIAVGSAQLLDNGNYHFEAGFIPNPYVQSYATEVAPDGTINYNMEGYLQTYRSYRMCSLYSSN
jgi:hypothetical protein